MAGFTALGLGALGGAIGSRLFRRRGRNEQAQQQAAPAAPQPTENLQVPDAPDANREASDATAEARGAAVRVRKRAARGTGNVRRRPRSAPATVGTKVGQGSQIGRPQQPRIYT